MKFDEALETASKVKLDILYSWPELISREEVNSLDFLIDFCLKLRKTINEDF